jgi:hypothetical protein
MLTPPHNFKFLTHEEFQLLSQSEKIQYISLAMDVLIDWSSTLAGDPFEKPERRNGRLS